MPSEKRNVCAVIPSAGFGTRVGASSPKLFLKINERNDFTVFDLIYGAISPFIDRAVVILSPRGVEYLESMPREERQRVKSRASIVVQERPIGTGDAVISGLQAVAGCEDLLVVWGDQAGISSESVRLAVEAHREQSKPRLTFPCVQVENPYIDYRLDSNGSTIISVRMRREGHVMDSTGCSDVGVFCLSVDGLAEAWQEFVGSPDSRGENSGELNFPTFLGFLSARKGWRTVTTEAGSANECRGINTKEDLAYFQSLFKYRAAG